MDLLTRVMELQQQGYSDAQIVQALRQEGVNPSEISDAFSQAKIKTAVSGTAQNGADPLPPVPPEEYSTEQNPPAAPPIPPPFEQQSQESYPQQEQYPSSEYAVNQPTQETQEYYPQTPQAYDSQGYPQQEYYTPQSTSSTEMIADVASQIVAEKFEEFKKETGDLPGFHERVKDKINRLDERLKHIEDTLNHLTKSIIGKIGEFGQNSSLIHKDLDNLHNTVSKLMDKKLDEHHERSHTTHHYKEAESHKKKKK